MALFNREVLIDNIYYLAKENNIKISDIEAAAGVTSGYLSRLKKESNKGAPSIEFIVAIANRLQVNVDTLINHALNTKTPTELLIIKFIDALIRQTNNEELEWCSESVEELSEVYYDLNENPLCHEISKLEYIYGRYEAYYESPYHLGSNVKPVDRFFFTSINNKASVFFVRYQVPIEDGSFPHSEPTIEYDLLMVNKEGKEKLAHYNAFKVSDIYNEKMTELYAAITDSSSRTHLSKNAKSAINDFLGIDDLPF